MTCGIIQVWRRSRIERRPCSTVTGLHRSWSRTVAQFHQLRNKPKNGKKPASSTFFSSMAENLEDHLYRLVHLGRHQVLSCNYSNSPNWLKEQMSWKEQTSKDVRSNRTSRVHQQTRSSVHELLGLLSHLRWSKGWAPRNRLSGEVRQERPRIYIYIYMFMFGIVRVSTMFF